MPLIEEMSPVKHRRSLRLTLMKRSWEDAGEDIDDPEPVTEYYDRHSGLVFVEFAGRRDVADVHRPDDDILVIEFESDG